MKIAIIGLPQAGKRTLFTLLTGRSVPEGRKPEETIEGIAWVRDPRIDALTDIFQPKKSAYAENNFVLCPDATTGGESYEWLNAARRCHLVCLALRAFEDDLAGREAPLEAEEDGMPQTWRSGLPASVEPWAVNSR